MTWRQHLHCRIEVHSKNETYVWEKALPIPAEVPMSELFVHNQKHGTKNLSLEARRVLWAYSNIHERIWEKASQEFAHFLSKLPKDGLSVDAYEAGVAVLMTLKQKPKAIQTVRSHRAPLEWLQKRSQLAKKLKIESVAYPDCHWCPAKRSRAA